jgi:GDP-4-dehydro-6-deoxy-D-mannose reductase
MKRSILLTGASGFVGSHAARLLVDRGWKVSALQRGSMGIDLPKGVKPIYADLLDSASLATIPRQWFGVIHLAGASVPSLFSTVAPVVQNVAMTLNLLEHLRDSRVLLVSSCHVYAPSDTPRHEDDGLVPQGRYGLSKHLIEQLAPHYAPRLDIRIARPFNHLGPFQRPELVVPSLLRRLAASRHDASPIRMAGLDSVRDFIDVRDVAAAYEAILGLEGPSYRIFNVCTGRPLSISKLVGSVLDLLGSTREVHFDGKPNSLDDIPNLVGNPERILSNSNWAPSISLERSLRDMMHTLQATLPREGRT